MTKQRDHVKSRRERRLCAYEGCPNYSGWDYRCEKHAAEHAARVKEAARKKREERQRGEAA